MSNDAGGWLWLLIDVLFVGALAAAIIYGTVMWHNRRKDRAFTQKRDAATKVQYQAEAMKEEAETPRRERVS